MKNVLLCFLCLFVAALAAGVSKDFPPGWNGLARTPPMGWRSWNAFGNRITQDMMLDAAAAIVSRNRTVGGRANVSLCDLGYCSVGVDEGWEGCGAGVDHTQHDARGFPTIDSAFPDTAKMVQQIHEMHLDVGWYLNGCKCGERVEKAINYQGDITDLRAFGFDGVKIDGCGKQRNMTLYAQLMKETGQNYTIENCHWGSCTDSDDSSCPTQEWCPMNWFRTSGDINSSPQSWLANLQTTIKFQDLDAPLAQPGCWAYPDMLEVGRVMEPAPGSFFTWNRAHFGAWCITSSPLILGLELTDAKLGPILDIIGNREAIAVNQHWSGHPGMLVENIEAPPVPYNPAGAIVPSSSAGDIDAISPAAMKQGPSDNFTSGQNIRSGNPGQVSRVLIGSGIIGSGHEISSVQMSFRYVAGYTGYGKAPTVRLVVLDLATNHELKTLLQTGPLGNYSYDHFTGYSPRVTVHATNLAIPNDSPVVLAMEITNNQRNLQIPIDDKAQGFGIRVEWAATGSGYIRQPTHQLEGVFGLGQLWAKPQPNGALAALLINHGSSSIDNHKIALAKLNLTAHEYDVRDIWNQQSVGAISTNLELSVQPYDSAFVLLSPKT
jgi:alpha-galactosidase